MSNDSLNILGHYYMLDSLFMSSDDEEKHEKVQKESKNKSFECVEYIFKYRDNAPC